MMLLKMILMNDNDDVTRDGVGVRASGDIGGENTEMGDGDKG